MNFVAMFADRNNHAANSTQEISSDAHRAALLRL